MSIATLLIRTSGPLQSWGINGRFSVRDAGNEPSHCGIAGLFGCASGARRDDVRIVTKFNQCRIGVRADRPGSLLHDYHTTGVGKMMTWGDREKKQHKLPQMDGGHSGKQVVADLYYLSDASFLVGIEGDPALLSALEQALLHPVWPLYLGRKGCVPSEPITLPGGGLRDLPLEEALLSYPWLIREKEHLLGLDDPRRAYLKATYNGPIRFIVTDPKGDFVRQDVITNFATRERRTRRVREFYKNIPSEEQHAQEGEQQPCSSAK